MKISQIFAFSMVVALCHICLASEVRKIQLANKENIKVMAETKPSGANLLAQSLFSFGSLFKPKPAAAGKVQTEREKFATTWNCLKCSSFLQCSWSWGCENFIKCANWCQLNKNGSCNIPPADLKKQCN